MPENWKSENYVSDYLARVNRMPHRPDGEAVLLGEIPKSTQRILDLGTGDGRLLALVLQHWPSAEGIGVDFSPTMLAGAQSRFQKNARVRLVEHNLTQKLPPLGSFDAVISSFAIHHLADERKHSLYEEIWHVLKPGGVFCNLEHVSSPTQRLHERYYQEIGQDVRDEDPSNQLLDAETQLRWLREIGFEDVDCLWKWREMALLAGIRPESS